VLICITLGDEPDVPGKSEHYLAEDGDSYQYEGSQGVRIIEDIYIAHLLILLFHLFVESSCSDSVVYKNSCFNENTSTSHIEIGEFNLHFLIYKFYS
jgi:hypothetical protein